jgi:hypothetical protein
MNLSSGPDHRIDDASLGTVTPFAAGTLEEADR